MRLLHLIGAPKPGGAETFALRLFQALHQHPDVTQHVLCRKGSWMAKRLQPTPVPFTEAPFGGVLDAWSPFGTHRVARQLAADFKPDVVLAWMNRGVRFMPQGPWGKVARLGGFYDLKYYRGRVTDLIGNTEAIADYCRAKGWPPSQVHHIPNFVPAPAPGWQAARGAQRAAWGWQEGDVGCVQMGRLHSVKGCDVALRALARLPKQFKLAFVGSGPQQAELEQMVTQLGLHGRVVFAGWADDIAPAAAAADLWLVPSRHEPLGNTALDAWAHGKPLIVAATGGLAMLVQDGAQGLAVPPEDDAALAAALNRLTNDAALQAHVVAGGQQRWQERYSESAIVAAYVAFFRHTMGRN